MTHSVYEKLFLCTVYQSPPPLISIPISASTILCIDHSLHLPISTSISLRIENLRIDQSPHRPISASTSLHIDQSLHWLVSASTSLYINQSLHRPVSAPPKTQLRFSPVSFQSTLLQTKFLPKKFAIVKTILWTSPNDFYFGFWKRKPAGHIVIKLFSSVIYGCLQWARVFVPGKPLQPNLMFTG
jgi:hypothetical protein